MEYGFLQLLRRFVGKNIEPLSENIDWSEVWALANNHGLLAILYDAVQQLPISIRPPQSMWLRWIGLVIQGYEQQFEAYCIAVEKLAAFYNANGYRMMLLKGLACGRDWPNPAHRPYGDIDIWLFGKQKEADAAMKQWHGKSRGSNGQEFQIDNSHHHHTVFNWMGFTVENHYDFTNVYHHKSSSELERIFKDLGQDDSHSVKLGETRIFLPSPNLHALFLLKHLVSHFASEKMTTRQLLDWAFFLKAHGRDVDWNWLMPIVEKYHLKEFLMIINAICVEDLGFQHIDFTDNTDILFTDTNDSNFTYIKERVFEEVLSPEFYERTPKNVLRRIHFKYRRWKANEWKHRLCYNETMYSAFWSGVKNHLIKPSSI